MFVWRHGRASEMACSRNPTLREGPLQAGGSLRVAGLESEFVLHRSPQDATQASAFVTVVVAGLVASNVLARL
jgi:hypothetical protein